MKEEEEEEEGGMATVYVQNAPAGVNVLGPVSQRGAEEILTKEALEFVAALHRNFNSRRLDLLKKRAERQLRIDDGEQPEFLAETKSIREDPSWRVASIPADLADRRVEITGPTERKMVINALNCGAKVFMADFEDALSPTWHNVIDGQINLIDAIRRTIEFKNPGDGRVYKLKEKGPLATLVVRPRGWHLVDKHLLVDGEPISGSLLDFGLYFFHNAKELLNGPLRSGPYFYLPKMESHLEARLWNDVFVFSQDKIGVPQGSVRATVLIETILAAYEMEEILYELRNHSSGLNAGRWDYLFSVIKKFRNRGKEFVLPDRAQLTMTVPFMRAYTELLVSTCHKRGAHAMGGMAAFIPSRRDAEVNRVAFAKVRDDKQREATDGFDGTWVAHPDLVEIATEIFDSIMGKDRPNQIETKKRSDVKVTAKQLLDLNIPNTAVTEGGVRVNVSAALQYIEGWLKGLGAVGINNLMEDAATAEISRSQIWQWIKQEVVLKDTGAKVTVDLVRKITDEEYNKLKTTLGQENFERSKFKDARTVFEAVALTKEFPEFLTLPAYEYLLTTKAKAGL
eukprot:TRINITY_DN1022_c0_g1_i1.p1 TRINITY_DN1022_c0_g1~~TRINITY_DN1022_c0_g1_i1.p1  ORF type:complete len:568 (-),score=177.82 TRINITY_DN1022_c0_g1_i1:95-1798(-)